MARMRMCLLIVAIFAFAGSVIPAVAQDGEGGPERVGFRPDAPTYAIRGPYWIGVRDFVIEPDSDRPLVTTMYYPALNPEGAEELATMSIGIADITGEEWDLEVMRGLRDAAPDMSGGPYPLVVFSSSGLSSRLYTPYILQHLASWGFVTLTTDHPGNDLRAQLLGAGSPEATSAMDQAYFEQMVLRMKDMAREIDYAEALTTTDGVLLGLIDMEKVVASGHAIGGYAALALAGGRPHYDYFPDALCAEPDLQDPLCELFVAETSPAREAELRALAGIEGEPGELWPSMADPRVDAVFTTLPAYVAAFGSDGLESMTAPVMMVSLEDLAWSTSIHSSDWLYEQVGSADAALVQYMNAGLGIFADCSEKWLHTDFFSDCADSVWDMNRAQDLLDHLVTAFLLAEVKDDAAARAALQPDAVTFPGIKYQTTLR